LAAKISTKFEKNPNFTKPKGAGRVFTIIHYAGQVTYDVQGWLDKNRDTLSYDLDTLLKNQCGEFISELFQTQNPSDPNAGKTTRKVTVAYKFRDQLQSLVAVLETTSPHYIRCIKPNDKKKSNEFDDNFVLNQLHALGIMQTVEMRQQGFAHRQTFIQFLDRYLMLLNFVDPALKSSTNAIKSLCKLILSKYAFHDPKYPSCWVVGDTKVFMKEEQFGYLEDIRNKFVEEIAIIVQSSIRGLLDRKKYLQMKEEHRKLQEMERALEKERLKIWQDQEEKKSTR